MDIEQKYQALWDFLYRNGRTKTPNVYLCERDGWAEREVCEMWVDPRHSEAIMYRTPSCRHGGGYHLYEDDYRHVRNAAHIYDQLKEDGRLIPRDKNLF